MSQYNIAEAKAQLSELARRALAGEEIIIARDNRPLVRLVPAQKAPVLRPLHSSSAPRVAGDPFHLVVDLGQRQLGLDHRQGDGFR